MLALRRVSTIHQYIHPLASYQYRFKSKKISNDETKQKPTHLGEELIDFERKSSTTSGNVFKPKKQMTNDDRLEKKQSITRKYFFFISK